MDNLERQLITKQIFICRVEEIASPYYEWRTHGFSVTLASVKGGEVIFDPASSSGDFLTKEADAFLKGKDTSELIKHTKAAFDISEEELNQYDAVFIPGGHGIMFDGPDNADLKKIIEHMWKQGKIVSAGKSRGNKCNSKLFSEGSGKKTREN